MHLSVIGCSHLGAAHAAATASFVHDVACTDVDHRKLHAEAPGVAPFLESGISEIGRP